MAFASLTADDPFTVDGEDHLYATIQNDQPVSVAGSVHFYHPDASAAANRFATVDFDARPHANTTFTLDWDGRIFGVPLTGDQTIHAKLTLDAHPAPANAHRTVDVTFRHHAVDVTAIAPADDAVAPGGLAIQTIEVTNTGNRADNFTLSVTDATPGWTFYMHDLGLTDVPTGATRTVALTVAAPANAAAGAKGTANITARAVDLLSAADTTRTASFEAAPLVDFALTATPADQEAAAGDTVTFDVRATNLGNQAIDLTLGTPAGLDLDETSLSLEPGTNAAVSASADVPDTGLAGTYLANVTATEPDTQTARTAWATLHVAPTPAFDVVGTSDGAVSLDVAPAGTGTIVVSVENQGNHWDRYTVMINDVPAGWSIQPAKDTVVVPPGLVSEVEFEVRVPAGTDPATYDLVAVAAPVDDEAADAKTLPVAVTVPEVAVPAVSLEAAVLPIEEGVPTDFLVTIRNVGNAAGDVTLTTPALDTAEPDDPAWDAQWQGEKTFSLAAKATTTRTVRVTAPSGLDASAEAAFDLEATTGDGSATAKIIAQTAAPDLAVTGIETAPAIHAEKTTTLTLRIANVGTQPVDDAVTVRVNATRDGVEVFTQNVEIADGLGWEAGDDTAVFNVAWTPAEGGDHVVTASVDPDEAIPEKHGDAGDADGNNNATSDVFVRVEDLVLVAPPASDATPGARTLLDGDGTFELRNLGNVVEYVQVTGASAPEGWNATAITTGPTLLAPGDRVPVPVLVDAPANPGPDDAPVQLAVAAVAGDLSGVVLLRVDDTSGPRIQNVTVEPVTGLIGQPVTILANVTDDTQVAWVDATLTAADGVQSRVTMVPVADAPGRFAATFTPTNPGAHRVHATAADAADPMNLASTQHDPFTFEAVFDPTPPHILFLAPSADGGPVKGASGLNFTVDDAYGVANVTYRVRAPGNATDVLVNQTVEPSIRYRVPLDGLPEETLVVEVRAVNVFGVAAETSRTFRIDNTAPQILDVSFLSNADGGFDVTARLAGTGDLSGIEIRARLANGSLERVAMANATTPDRYVAHVPGMNLTQWWIAAWDHVGNAAIEELASPEGQSANVDGGSSTGLAAPFLAAALAFAAAAVRQRRNGDFNS